MVINRKKKHIYYTIIKNKTKSIKIDFLIENKSKLKINKIYETK